jgi:hypothetical protein
LKRKLLLLNLGLAAFVAYAGFELRQAWLAEKAREAAELNKAVKPSAPIPFAPLAVAPPVAPAGYAAIAEQTLFDRSRNPNVVVDVPPPPPPKPMPPLPVYHGQMNIGSGPMAILSATANSPHLGLHPGETIGPFKLVEVDREEITLEWEGKAIRKNVDELVDRSAQGAAAAPAAVTARTEQSAAAAPAPPPPGPAKSAIGPGADTGAGFKRCEPNDSTPAGTVVDGYRKVISPTPFGEACRWDPVGR